MRAEKRPHEWLGGVLGVLGLAPLARTSQIQQKVLKGYRENKIDENGIPPLASAMRFCD